MRQMLPTANPKDNAFWGGRREERHKWVTGCGEVVVAPAPPPVLGEPGALSSPLSNARQAGCHEFILPQLPFPPAVAVRKAAIPRARYAAPTCH
jgi:hypothetical protein